MKQLKALSALALAFVLLVFLSVAASAQTTETLSGRVLDAQGNPVAGLWFGLEQWSSQEQKNVVVVETTTDANGGFTFPVLASYGYTWVLGSRQPGSCPTSGGGPSGPCLYFASAWAIGSGVPVDFVLPYKRVSVHVVDPNGQPLAGAGLATNQPASDQVPMESLGGTLFSGSSSYAYDPNGSGGVTTDAYGNATLWLLPVTYQSGSGSSYSITVNPPAATGLPAKTLAPIYVAGDTSLTISYVSSVTLSGRVTDAQSNPLAGLSIALRTSTVTDTITDADGRYSLSVAPDNYGLIVTNSSSGNCPSYGVGLYGPWCFRIDSSPYSGVSLTQNMTLDLPLPFKRVNVHVVDGNGQPIVGAALGTNNPTSDQFTLGGVTFTGNSSYYYDPNVGGGLKTDASGNATLWLLPVTPSSGLEWYYTITAYPPAATNLPVKSLPSVWVSGDTSFTISYMSSVGLSGRITDAAGNGLPNQTIELWGPDYPSGSTDSSGNYTFAVSPGYYTMWIKGGVPLDSGLHAPEQYEAQSDPHAIAVTQDGTLDLALPFQRMNVHVVDANDQPIAGAALDVQVRGVDPLTLGGVPFWGVTWHGGLYSSLTTNISGNVTLWLWPASDQPWEGDGYWLMTYPPAETGLSPIYTPPVFVTGETNVTVRSPGALPGGVPVISNLSPSFIAAESPSFTLTVGGSGFVNSSVVRWNGADRSTTYVSNTQLTAVISSADIAAPGTANVTVWTPSPGGGLSNSVPFTITPPSATINVYAAMHTTGTGATSGDQKSPLALRLKVFDRATFPSAELKDYASVWNSGPGLISPWARITGPTVTTFSNGPANLYTVRVPATSSANNMTSGRYLVVGKVEGAEAYVGAATDPLAVDSVTDEYFQITQKSDGASVSAVSTPGSGSPLTAPTPTPTAKATPKATQTPKPKPTPAVVSASPTPKPTATPKKTPPATRTAAPTKTSPAKPKAPPTQTPVPAASATPKKAPTIAPLATGTLPPTKTPHPTMTPRDTPKKH